MAGKKVGNFGTAVGPCTCRNDYQDATYGRGRRVHNWAPKKQTNGRFVCTVCTAQHTRTELGVADLVVEEKKEEVKK
jgi:hypothetical protein